MGYYDEPYDLGTPFYKIRESVDNKLYVDKLYNDYIQEYNFDHDVFLQDDEGVDYGFKTLEEAEDWLNDNIKREHIDEDHVHLRHRKKDYFK